MACGGCGHETVRLDRGDAVTMARFVKRRYEALLAHPARSVRARHRAGSWSVTESVAMVSEILDGVHSGLRALFDLDVAPSGVAPINGPGTTVAGPALSDSVAESADRLVATIEAVSDETWGDARFANGPSVTELVWLALHDAIHFLEDTDLVLRTPTTTQPPASPATELLDVPGPAPGRVAGAAAEDDDDAATARWRLRGR